MGVTRLLAVFMFGLLVGAQSLLLPDSAYAWCSCGMTCPTPRCQCDPGCAVSDVQNFQAANFQIRNVQSSLLFTNSSADIDMVSGFRLIAAPQAFLKVQCQRIAGMLSWVSDIHIQNLAFQGTLQ